MSGHIFFADDYYGYDDAIYVAARTIQTLSRNTLSLSELRKEIPRYYSTPEMRLECGSDEEKFKIAKDIDEEYYENYLIAKKAGVNFLAYRCDISSKKIFIDKKLKIIDDWL